MISSIERCNTKYQSSKEIVSLSLQFRISQKSRTSQTLNLMKEKVRRDIFRSIISKGSKMHKVSFIDYQLPIKDETENEKDTNCQQPIAEIINVQSFKELNAKMSYNDYDKYPNQVENTCCESSSYCIF